MGDKYKNRCGCMEGIKMALGGLGEKRLGNELTYAEGCRVIHAD
jgi:hypothetical protein